MIKTNINEFITSLNEGLIISWNGGKIQFNANKDVKFHVKFVHEIYIEEQPTYDHKSKCWTFNTTMSNVESISELDSEDILLNSMMFVIYSTLGDMPESNLI